jgi:hypothetical protein
MNKLYAIIFACLALFTFSCQSSTKDDSIEEMDEYGVVSDTDSTYIFVYKTRNDVIEVGYKNQRKTFHCNESVQRKIIDFFNFQFDRKNMVIPKPITIFHGNSVFIMMLYHGDKFTLNYSGITKNSEVSEKFDELIKFLKAEKILNQDWGIVDKN